MLGSVRNRPPRSASSTRLLLLVVLGGDAARDIGGGITAVEVLQREVGDEIARRARDIGAGLGRYSRQHGMKDPETITAWLRGRGVHAEEAEAALSVSRVNVCAAQIGRVLSLRYPEGLSWDKLLRHLGELSPRDELPNPAVVDPALGKLQLQDLLIIRPGPRPTFALRRPNYVESVEELEERSQLAERLMSVVPGLASAFGRGHPAATVWSGTWCVRRADVEGILEELLARFEERHARATHSGAPGNLEQAPDEGTATARLSIVAKIGSCPLFARR